MDLLQPAILLPALAVSVLAGLLKGSIGFGFPLVSVPLLAMLIGTRQAVVVVVLPLLVANVLLVIQRREILGGIVSRVVPIVAPLVPASAIGALLLSRLNSATLSVVVGGLIVALALLSSVERLRVEVTPRTERVVSPLVGAFAGLVGGSTSIPGPLLAMYLISLGLAKAPFVYAISVLFVSNGITQVASYARLGLYADGTLWLSLALTPAALLGQAMGFRLQRLLHPEAFRIVVLVVVVVSGSNLVLRGLSAP